MRYPSALNKLQNIYCLFEQVGSWTTCLPTRKEARQHNQFLSKQMKNGAYNNDKKKKRQIQKDIDEFDPKDYSISYPHEVLEKFCGVFGYMCPVFIVGEPFTETNRIRNVSRYIPTDVMLRVVRRDNSTCQICGIHLMDNQIQFDHKIPVSKGGPSTESNVRLTCEDCNQYKKGNIDFSQW